MNAVLLILIILGTLQQVCKKAFNIRVSGGAYSFSAASTLFAIIVFVLTSKGRFAVSAEVLVYSLIFAAAYCVATVGSMLAISTGPLALTSLVVQYSLVIPTVYGLLVLDEPMDFWLICGILLLLVSLVFINCETKGEKKKITLRWGIYAFVTFVSNGACSTVQKIQQLACDGMYKNEFMIVALTVSAVTMMVFALWQEKDYICVSLKKGAPWYIMCGLANGGVNYLALVLALRMPASVLFPVVSAGGIITTALVSMLVYKEKLSHFQKLGFLLGIMSIVALNL